MKCATHPEVETNLRCGKCGKPICPKCMVQTPVGARCPDCARLYKLPTFSISTSHYLKAVGVGLGMALICGLLWGLIEKWVPFFYFSLLLAPGIGYAIGELVSLAANRKRGTGLAVIAGIAVVVSYLVSILSPWGLGFSLNMLYLLLDLVPVALGIYIAVARIR